METSATHVHASLDNSQGLIATMSEPGKIRPGQPVLPTAREQQQQRRRKKIPKPGKPVKEEEKNDKKRRVDEYI